MKLQARGAVCVVILCLATAGYAQQGTNQSGTLSPGTAVSGSIVSVSNDVIVVRTDAGETMRFNRDASVNVPSNLMAGNRVSVEYNRITADNMRLTRIDLDGSNTTGNSNYNNSTTGNSTTGYSRLPQTASPLVMLAFAGLVSLGGALALRARRRR